jgi:hypothetical protein
MGNIIASEGIKVLVTEAPGTSFIHLVVVFIMHEFEIGTNGTAYHLANMIRALRLNLICDSAEHNKIWYWINLYWIKMHLIEHTVLFLEIIAWFVASLDKPHVYLVCCIGNVTRAEGIQQL